MKIKCKHCGKEFETNDYRVKYCSDDCRKNGYNKSYLKIKEYRMKNCLCLNCGKKKEPDRANKMRCLQCEHDLNERVRKKYNDIDNVCNEDCLNCKYPDCIKDVPKENKFREKRLEYNRRRDKEKMKEYNTKSYQKKINETVMKGKCIVCGKPLCGTSNYRCESCRNKHNETMRLWRANKKERIADSVLLVENTHTHNQGKLIKN